jgi:hypothetical protein
MRFVITLSGHEKWFNITSSGQEKWFVISSNFVITGVAAVATDSEPRDTKFLTSSVFHILVTHHRSTSIKTVSLPSPVSFREPKSCLASAA